MASHLLTTVIKGLAGGTFVVLFALLGETIRPRGLAGITSAAPSVAAAGLLVSVLATGALAAWNLALGMIAGAVALVAYCLVGTEAVKRLGALRGSVAAMVLWFAAAFGLWAVALR